MGEDIAVQIIGSIIGAGGGAWAVVKVQLKYLHDGIKEAKETAKGAHRRIDSLYSHHSKGN